jgi:hypothetical protein
VRVTRPPSLDPIEPEGLFDGLSGAAILFGAVVDLGATIFASLLVMALAAPREAAADPAAAAEAMEAFYASGPLAALDLALGLVCTAFGAFVGARRAGKLHVRHGGWIAVTSTAMIAFLMLLAPPAPAAQGPELPLWYEALAWILIIPAGVAGGALAAALDRSAR